MPKISRFSENIPLISRTNSYGNCIVNICRRKLQTPSLPESNTIGMSQRQQEQPQQSVFDVMSSVYECPPYEEIPSLDTGPGQRQDETIVKNVCDTGSVLSLISTE